MSPPQVRAFQITGFRCAEVRDIPVPAPGPGEVMLRVTGAGVCHSDVHLRHVGHKVFSLPMTLGHETSGTIAALGEGVSGWEVGQPALVYLCWGCGNCRACESGAENYCEGFPRGTVPGPGMGYEGGMAELIVAPARQIVEIGDLDPVAAAPLVDAALTSYHAISLSRDRLEPWSTVVMIGVGGLGHMAVQIVRAISDATIVAVDTDEGRLRQAIERGADHALPSDERAAEEVLKLTGGRGADVVLDFVGAEPTLAFAAGCISTRGRIAVVGLSRGELSFTAAGPPLGLPWGVSVIKPYAGTRPDLQQVLALAAAGEIVVNANRFPLAQAPRVLDQLEQGEIDGRAVLVP